MVKICSIPTSVPMTGPQRGGGAEPEDVGTGGGSHGAAQRDEGTEGDLILIARWWFDWNHGIMDSCWVSSQLGIRIPADHHMGVSENVGYIPNEIAM